MAMLVITTDRDIARDLQDGSGRVEPLTNSELRAPLRLLGLSDIEITIVRDAMRRGTTAPLPQHSTARLREKRPSISPVA